MMTNATRKTVMDGKSPFVTPQATRVMPQLWCTACAKLTWMVTLEEANQLISGQPCHSHKTDEEQYVQAVTKGHQMKLSSGTLVVCLHALFPKAF